MNIEIPQLHSSITKKVNHIIDLSDIIEGGNIIMLFNGTFTQTCLLNLLSIFEEQLKEKINISKMKLTSIIIEMVQNIVKHGAGHNNKMTGKPGMFMVTVKDKQIRLITGNYIKNSQIKDFSKRIEHVNNLTVKKLEEFYNDTLFNFKKINDKEIGLGIIDLRLKSKSKLDYHFRKLDREYSFYMLKTNVIA